MKIQDEESKSIIKLILMRRRINLAYRTRIAFRLSRGILAAEAAGVTELRSDIPVSVCNWRGYVLRLAAGRARLRQLFDITLMPMAVTLTYTTHLIGQEEREPLLPELAAKSDPTGAGSRSK